MTDFIIIAVIALILGTAIYYIFRKKKQGVACIGCPAAHNCGGKCKCQEKG